MNLLLVKLSAHGFNKSAIALIADSNQIKLMIENKSVNCRSGVKILSIKIGDKVSFTTHNENLCSTASNRLQALAKIYTFSSSEQAKHLSKAYIISTFRYCCLIWMFCSKATNNLITKIHNAAYVLCMK